MRPIGNQRKMFRDSDRTAHVQSRAAGREIPDHAIDSTTAELNRSGFQHTVSRYYPAIIHLIETH